MIFILNPNTISYYRYQDIQIPDVQLRQEFNAYMAQGNYSQALQTLYGNEQLDGKAFVASTINRIITGVEYVQSLYWDNVPVFLSDLATKYFALVDNFRNRQTWLATEQYIPYNFVIYLEKVYMCLQETPIGTEPTNITYWLELGLEGRDGVDGVDVNMRYDWSAFANYQPNDLVIYKGNIYVALIPNTAIEPDTDENTWLLFLVVGTGEISIGISPPQKFTHNSVWFSTVSNVTTQSDLTPVTGTFKRYDTFLSDWETMNPNTVHTQIINYETLASNVRNFDVTIATTDWQNNTWQYQIDNLTDDSVVNIMPNGVYNEQQSTLLSVLSISIADNTITLIKNTTTTVVDLPILIRTW